MSPLKPDVLLIEDNDDDVELAVREFKKVGFENNIHVVASGEEALNYLFAQGAASTHLILLDLNLPKAPGLEVLRQIRLNLKTRHIPVVILTVSKKEPDLLQSFTMGICDYLIKPLNAGRFEQIYRKYVRKNE